MSAIWLDAEGVGMMIGQTPRNVRERVALRTGFPQPSRATGHPRWNAAEVMEWKREQDRPPPPPRRERASARPEYNLWKKMHDRCRNPRAVQWKWYGGRGIRVCEAWRSFGRFIADMGPRPAGMSLDRINTNGNYEAANCRWATSAEQNANRRCPRCGKVHPCS